MNRPRRPAATPPRKRPTGPPRPPGGEGPPRRRSPIDTIPQNVEPKFKVLGTGVDRQTVSTGANPMELVVIHGFTREIEETLLKYKGRADDFWKQNPKLLETARKLDDLFAGIQSRKAP